MKVGRFIQGSFRVLSEGQYLSLGAESDVHQVYELRVKTTRMSAEDVRAVTANLLKFRNEGMETLGVDVGGDSVRMQVTGSPFLWAPLIAALPALIGPIIALIIGVIIIYQIPSWAWALPFIAGSAAIIFYAYRGKPPLVIRVTRKS